MVKLPGDASSRGWSEGTTVTVEQTAPVVQRQEPIEVAPAVLEPAKPTGPDPFEELKSLGSDTGGVMDLPKLFEPQSPLADELTRDGTLGKMAAEQDGKKAAEANKGYLQSAWETMKGAFDEGDNSQQSVLKYNPVADFIIGRLTKKAQDGQTIDRGTPFNAVSEGVGAAAESAGFDGFSRWVTTPSEFNKAWSRGMSGVAQMTGSGIRQYGETLGSDVVKAAGDMLVEGSRPIREAKSLKPAVEIYSDIRKEQWFNDTANYLSSKLGEGLGNMAAIGAFYAAGGTAGGVGFLYTMSVGEVRDELVEAGIKDEGTIAKYAYGAGLVVASLERIFPEGVMRELTEPVKKKLVSGLVKSFARGAVKGGATEGVTEALQEAVEIAAVAHAKDARHLFDMDPIVDAFSKGANWERLMEAAISGAVPGGAIGGVSSTTARYSNRLDPVDENASQKPQAGPTAAVPPVEATTPPKPTKPARSSADIGAAAPIAIRPVQSIAETENEVVTPDGSMALPVETVLVELDDLVYATGDLQPRDRSRKESADGVRYRAANLDPSRLLPQRVSDVGAPIVATDGTIVSGNGRVLSISEVYRDPALASRAEAYRQALGPDAEGMRNPVLIRRLAKDVAPADLVKFADLSNRPAIAQMSATERAGRDARAATPDVMRLYTGGDFTSPANRDFLRAFVNSAVSPTERGAMARDGMLTQEGESRLTSAVLAATYENPDVLARMLESTDDNIRSISGAMRDASGAMLALKQSIANGETDPQFDITPMVAEAALRIADMRSKGIKPANMLAQQDAFTQVDPIVESLIRAFYNDDMTRPVSRKAMTDVLTFYAREAALHSGQEGLIPDDTTAEEVLDLARRRALSGEDDAGSLFSDGESLIGRDNAGPRGEDGQSGPVYSGAPSSEEADINTEEFSAKFVGKKKAEKERKAAVDQGQVDLFNELFGASEAKSSSEAMSAAFAEVLAGTALRKDWQSLIGATSEEIQALEQEAVKDGRLRVSASGQVRRTGKAKTAVPSSPIQGQDNSTVSSQINAVTEQVPANETPIDASTIQTVDDLQNLLVKYGIDPSLYGKGEAKSLASLLKELKKGESQLLDRDGKLIRKLSTLALDVYTERDGQRFKLYEDRQEFKDGRTRRRPLDSSLGEKLEVGENPADSVLRAIKEELGITDVTQTSELTSKTVSANSPSFPSLSSEYEIFRAAVDVGPSQFQDEYAEHQAEKSNYMRWFPVIGGDERSPNIEGSPLYLERELLDAPNFGMPAPPETIQDGDPLLVSHDKDTSPERLAMRERLVAQRFAGKAPAVETPVIYIMGGGSGSGKGGVIDRLRKAGALTDNFVEIDPDSFKTGDKAKGWDGIPEYWDIDARGDSRASKVVHEESSLIAKEAMRRATDGKYDVLYDVTLGTPNKAEEILLGLKDKGYRIVLIGVSIPTETAIRRSIDRFSTEKRYVPMRALLENHRGFATGFERYAEIADVVRLVDTDVSRGEAPFLMAKKSEGGDLQIVNNDLYLEFGRKVQLDETANTIRQLRETQGSPRRNFGDAGPSFDRFDAGTMGGVIRGGPAEAGRVSQPSQDGPSLRGSGLTETTASPVTPGFSISIDPGLRIDRAIALRETATGLSVNAIVSDYALRAETVRGDLDATRALVAEIAADKVIRKADALELAHLVGYPPNKATTKKAALQSIIDRAKAFNEANQLDLLMMVEPTNENPELRPATRTLPENEVPEGLEGSEGQRGIGSAPEGEAAGSGGNVRGNAGGNDLQPGLAEGSGSQSGGDVGASDVDRRNSEERDRVRAIVEKARKEHDDRTAKNYRITDADELGQGGDKTKVRQNIEAIRVLRTIEDEKRPATEDEKKILIKYVGWGAFSQQVFDDNKYSPHAEKWAAERQELKGLLSVEDYAEARKSTRNAHYTSQSVVDGMWDGLRHLGFKGGRTLEPSAGTGHFIGLMPEDMLQNSSWTAVELDPTTAGIARALYGGADVRTGGFEKQKWPDNFFDLAISNVPFGDYTIDDKTPHLKGLFIHDYFFVRSLDKVRPGGIVAYITSKGTLDKGSERARKEIAKRADFLGAIRLPGGNKGAFAKNAGTEVTTDIIFLRKRAEGEAPLGDQTSWQELATIKTPEGPTEINRYFADNPQMMLGKMRLIGSQYGANEPVLIGSSENLREKIATAISENIAADLYLDQASPVATLSEPIDASDTPGVKEGAYYSQNGKFYRKVMGVGEPQALAKTDIAKMGAFLRIRDAMNQLLAVQARGEKDNLDALRATLSSEYDAFVRKFGPISRTITKAMNRLDKKGEPIIQKRTPNFSLFKADPDAYKVLALEIYNEDTDTAEKAAIFTEDVLATYVRPEISSPADALAVSLNEHGRVNINAIAEHLQVSRDEAIEFMGDMVFENPNSREFEARDDYLSGDVVSKLEDARAAAETDPYYAKNVAALEEVQPAPLTRADIRLLMGAPWIDPAIYKSFLQEVLGADRVTVSWLPGSNRWVVSDAYYSAAARAEYGTDHASLKDIVKAAINNEQLTIKDEFTDSDGNVQKVVNPEKSEAAQIKVKALRDRFAGNFEEGIDAWVWENEARAVDVETKYNAYINRIVTKVQDGSHLNFPGLARVISFGNGETGQINLPAYRTGAIWRIITKGNTLLAHAVGAGKTFTMIMSGMEQKRLGLVQRPAYVVPNHMLEQFSREFLQAYPNAKLLVADKDMMTKDRRKEFAARVAAEKWDGVIITHDAFGRIQMDPAFEQSYLKKQIDEIIEAIKQAKEAEGKRAPTVKDLEKKKTRLENKLKALTNRERKDEGITFEETGIDFLYVDEAHLFKNLDYSTRHGRVRGLSQRPSQRATDLHMKMEYLNARKPGRAAVFATGTPVSNTMAEFYTMMKYMRPDILEQYNIKDFDAWISTFGEMTTSAEVAPNGRDVREVASFSRFVNIPELMTLYNEFADVQTAAMLKLRVPVRKGGAPTIVKAQLNAYEERVVQDLVRRAEAVKGKKPEKGADNILAVMSDGRKIATDARLFDSSAEINPNGKTELAVQNIFKIWKEGKEPALAQVVFLDTGTPSTGKAKTKTKPDDDIADTLDDDGNSVDVDETESEVFASKFNLYQAMKDRLVEQGIPKEQIAFIHDATDDVKKGRMFKAVNEGKIRVIFGSTGKMGVGTNIQKRLTAIHHVDIAWRPADYTQRNGRIERQGNKNTEFQEFIYITEASLDSYFWQTLERKTNFISQLEAGARGVREAEDIDSPMPSVAEIKAAATGNPLIMEHAELKKSVRILEAQKRGQERTTIRARQQLQSDKAHLTHVKKLIAETADDAASVVDLSGDKFSVTFGGDMVRNETQVTKRAEAGAAIVTYLNNFGSRLYSGQVSEVSLGQISGLTMIARLKKVEGGSIAASLKISGRNQMYGVDQFFFVDEKTNGLGLVRRYERITQEVVDAHNNLIAQAATIENEEEKLKQQAEGKPFARQADLENQRARLEELEVLLDPAKLAKRQQAEAKAAEAVPRPMAAAEYRQDNSLAALRTTLTAPGVYPAILEGGDGLAALRAYHGSAHAFSRFDMGRIGSGEGAQAYGRGLYFAENEGVAKGYKKSVGYKQIVKDFRDWLADDAEFEEIMQVVESGELPEPMVEVIRALEADDWLGFDYAAQAITAIFKADAFRGGLQQYDASERLVEAVKNYGNVYEVSINANPEDMLDWDKQLLKQDPKIAKAISGILGFDASKYSGREAYQEIGMKLGRSTEAASKALREAGILGIRYLDQVSRGAGEGTSNFVVFDDSLVEITSVNGKPVSKEVRDQVVADLRDDAAAAFGTAEFSKNFTDALPEWIDQVAAEARRILPADVAVRFDDRIFHRGNELDAVYHPGKKLLEIGLMQGVTRALQLARHEAVHVARMGNLFDSAEWTLLLERAAKIGIDDQIKAVSADGSKLVPAMPLYEAMYGAQADARGLTGADRDVFVNERLNQERVAKMAEQWVAGKADYGSTINALLERLRGLIEALVNAARGLGFQTADDVFQKFNSGEVADRSDAGRNQPTFAPERRSGSVGSVGSVERDMALEGFGLPVFKLRDYFTETGIDKLAERLGATSILKLRPWSKHPGRVLAFHGTEAVFDRFDLSKTEDFGLHFGTADQANKFAEGRAYRPRSASDGQQGSVIPVVLDLNKVIDLPDLNRWSPKEMVDALRKVGVRMSSTASGALDRAIQINQREAAYRIMRDDLTAQGYDGIRYLNGAEGGGLTWSYIVWEKGKVSSATAGDELFALSMDKPATLPKGVTADFNTNSMGQTNVDIKKDGVSIGRAYVRSWPKSVQIGQFHIDKGHQRQGIGTAIHEEIQRKLGRPVVPDATISKAEYQRWLKYDPIAVADYELQFKGGTEYSPRQGSEGYYTSMGGYPLPGTKAAAFLRSSVGESRRTFAIPGTDGGSISSKTKPDGNRVRTYKVDGTGFVTISEQKDGTWAIQMLDARKPQSLYGLIEQVQVDLGQRLSPKGWLTPDAYTYWMETDPNKVKGHVNAGPLFNGLYVPVDQIDFAIETLGEVAVKSPDADVTKRAALQIQQLKALKAQSAPVAEDLMAAFRQLPTPIEIGSQPTNAINNMDPLQKTLTDLVKQVTDAMGLTLRMGRLNPGLKAAAGRRGGWIAGQHSSKTGVTRLAIPNDLVTLAHEGGHHLESSAKFKDAIEGLKRKHAEDLVLPPMPDVVPPKFPAAGFSGVEIDAETQQILVSAVKADEQLRQMSTQVGNAKSNRSTLGAARPIYDIRAYQQLQELAGSLRERLGRRLGKRIADAAMDDMRASGANNLAGYAAVRFSASGQPSPRAKITWTKKQLSEGFADWFSQYVISRDSAKTIAPAMTDEFENVVDGIDPDMLEALEGVQSGYQKLLQASPVQAVASRVQSTIREGKLAELRKTVDEKGWRDTLNDWVYAFYTAAIDGKHPMKVAVKYLMQTAAENLGVKLGDKERIVLKAIDDPYKRWRLAEHSKVHATNVIQNGVRFAGDDMPTGPSYHDALSIAFGGTLSRQWNEQKANLFGSYLISRRMLAEFGRFDRGELENQPDLLIKRDTWQSAKEQLEIKYPEFAQAADVMYEFSKNVLKWKTQEGFITKETYDDLIQRVDYTPLNRIMDDKSPSSLTSATGPNKSKMIQRFMGSTRDFINPLESIVQDVYATQARVALNGVIRSMDKLARAAGPGGGAIAERIPAKDMIGTKIDIRVAMKSAAKAQGLAESDFDGIMEIIDDLFDQDAAANIFRATDTNEKGEPILYLWEGGKRVPIRIGDDQIGKDIFDQMVAFGQDNADLLVDTGTLFTQALRAGVTKAPAYVAVNFLRDQLSTWILSDVFTPFVTGTKGLKSTVMNGPDAIRFQAFGGQMGGVDARLMDSAAGDRDILSLRKKGFWSTPGGSVAGRTWNGFLRTMEVTEAATRVGHFEAARQRALKDGLNNEEAAFEAAYSAHDVMDFSRRGSRMQTVSRLVAFLNASLQGLDAGRRTIVGERDTATAYRKLATPYIKAVSGSPLSVAERRDLPNSTRAFLKMLTIGMIGVALSALYSDDDEAEEINDYMRATHWFFKLGGTWYRYPKPFELAIFSNAFEAGFDRLWKNDPRAFTKFVSSLQHTVVPPHELQAMKFFYELKTGKDTFRDRDIVGMDIAGLPPELQYNAYTSEFGKLVGSTAGLSPAMVDHFMQSAFATVGRDVLTVSDYVLPRVNQVTGGALPGVSVTPRAEKSVEDYWFVSRFSRRAARGSLSSEYFWKQMSPSGGEYAAFAQGYKKLYEAGRVDPRTSIEAKAMLSKMTDDQKAFAYLETHFTEKEQDVHPLNRAKQVMNIASGIRKEMILGGLIKQDSKKKNLEPELVDLPFSAQKKVNEILEDVSMREARNALIVTGVEGWAQKDIMPTDGLIDELRAVAPDVADEFEARQTKGRNKVYSFEAVKALWPELRKRLLEEGPDAMVSDIAAEAGGY